jgi:dolichol-phosphate mannosyltransferase
MKISFVIPVFNNALTLIDLNTQLATLCAKNDWSYEIIFVDDCSKDSSLQLLSQIKNNTIVIQLKKNNGQSTAVLLGLKHITGDVAVAMDADLQDRPEFVPELINKINNGIDIAFSGRSGKYENSSKLFSAKTFKYLLHLLSKKRLPVDACMFFAIKNNAIKPLLSYTGAKPYLLSVIAKKKLNCVSVPYVRTANNLSKSNYTFIKRWKVGIKGISNFFFLKEKELPESEYIILQKN